MRYLFKLLLSLKEIFFITIIEYIILFISFIIFGENKTIIWGSIGIIIMQVIYIICMVKKYKLFKCNFNIKNYFPYIPLGVGLASIYNMIIFMLGLEKDVNVDTSIVFNLLCSGIIGPIFEEILFRYNLTKKLEKFNTNKWIIIILSSIIFAFMHTGYTTIVYAFVMGIILSYFYVKEKNIVIPIIIHISGNILVTFLTSYNPWILILGIILVIINLLIIKNSD